MMRHFNHAWICHCIIEENNKWIAECGFDPQVPAANEPSAVVRERQMNARNLRERNEAMARVALLNARLDERERAYVRRACDRDLARDFHALGVAPSWT
jgi:hypothetical protein